MFSHLKTILSLGLAVTGAAVAMPTAGTSVSARQTFSGTATFFAQGGVPGACGVVHSDSDFIVALQINTYAGGIHCGASITLTDTNTGTTATAIVADECVTCNGAGSLDLSLGLFQVFAPLSQGEFPVSWSFN